MPKQEVIISLEFEYIQSDETGRFKLNVHKYNDLTQKVVLR